MFDQISDFIAFQDGPTIAVEFAMLAALAGAIYLMIARSERKVKKLNRTRRSENDLRTRGA